MTARFFDLEAIGLRLLEDSRHRAVMLRGRGIVPCLALIEVGEDPQSAAYVTRKIEDCKKVGIDVRKVVLPQSVTQSALLAQVQMLDADNAVSGILVQLPLPSHLDEDAVIQASSPHKDVDGLKLQVMTYITIASWLLEAKGTASSGP